MHEEAYRVSTEVGGNQPDDQWFVGIRRITMGDERVRIASMQRAPKSMGRRQCSIVLRWIVVKTEQIIAVRCRVGRRYCQGPLIGGLGLAEAPLVLKNTPAIVVGRSKVRPDPQCLVKGDEGIRQAPKLLQRDAPIEVRHGMVRLDA